MNALSRRQLRRIIAAIGLIVLAAAVVYRSGWRGAAAAVPQPLVRSAAEQQRYVGSQACAQCHAEIYASYQRHPMAQALSTHEGALADPSIGNPFSPVDHAELSYWVEETPQGVRHHEIRYGSDSQVLYDQSFPIAYVLGSGRRGRSYLIQREGYLFLSPISWYASNHRWDLAPGYQPGHHKRFGREAVERCLLCHSGRLNEAVLDGNEALRYASPPFLEWGIGCERCHGPGARHAQARQAGRTVDQDIVHPGKLDPARRDAVCAQCHLQGAYQILRAGKWHADFQPGQLLSDVWTTFVAGVGVDDQSQSTLAVSQVQQMVDSQCYRASQGQLGCASCHDPHQPAPEEPETRSDYFRSRCLTCHDAGTCTGTTAARQARRDQCTACHMPPLAAQDVPHTSQTDHRIIRRPESTAPSSDGSSSQLGVFALSDEEYRLAERERALALVWAQQAENGADRVLAARALRVLRSQATQDPDDLATADALALCEALVGQTDAALARWNALLERQPLRRVALQSVAALQLARGDAAASAATFARLIASYPYPASWRLQYSRVLSQLGKNQEAVQQALAATQADPSQADYWSWLAELAARVGESRTKDRALRMAQGLSPQVFP